MTEYFDQLEIRTQEQRERELFVALTAQLAHAQAQAPAYQTLLADIDPMAVVDRAALAHVPVTRKSDIAAQQAAAPPFGGYVPWQVFHRRQHRCGGDDHWQMGRALHALGVRPGDLVHNTFSYHFTPAGLMLDSAFRAFGCAVFPAGVGQTELQVQAIAHFKPRVYSGTPSFLKIIFDKAGEMGADVSSLELGAVGGDALPNSLREELSDNGVGVLQFYGTADVGLIAFESEAKEGMILDESVIVEIVRPGTGDPVTEGEVGEVLVTTLNPYYPLIRFATGDLSAFMSGDSPCGRTNQRIKGWMGRADQTSKVRGMFVHPSQVADVVARHHEIIRARLVIDSLDNQDSMTLRCEVSDREVDLEQAVSKTIREVCKVRGEVEIVGKGTLPNDGLVIDDQRSYD